MLYYLFCSNNIRHLKKKYGLFPYCKKIRENTIKFAFKLFQFLAFNLSNLNFYYHQNNGNHNKKEMTMYEFSSIINHNTRV